MPEAMTNAGTLTRPAYLAPGAIALIQVVIGYTWALTGFRKLAGGAVPEWFGQTFGSTFLATFPGLTASFYSIAVLESATAALAILALLTGEFLPWRRKLLTRLSLLGSMLVFAQLGFGQRLVEKHDGAAELFMYFALTAGLLVVVEFLSGCAPAQRRASAP